jgi:hypothetical protein
MLVFVADTTSRDDEEVAVARSVATAERERADEIDPDQVRVQDRLDAANEVGEEFVQVRKWRRARCCQPATASVTHAVRVADRGLGQRAGMSPEDRAQRPRP